MASRRTAVTRRRCTSARSPHTARRRSTGAPGSSWTTACGAEFHGSRASRASSMPDAAWSALAAHATTMRDLTLRELFDREPARGDRLHLDAAGWYFDIAKHRVTDETLRLLINLAEARDVRARIEAMFRGDHVNVTEDRPALHVALRMAEGT